MADIDKLMALLADVFESHVAELFEEASRLPGADREITSPSIPIPYIGLKYGAGHAPPFMQSRVVAALLAREHFRHEAPGWRSIPLPLRWEDIEAFEQADDVRLNLVGLYGTSLRWEDWDIARHPPFAVYASGLMAYESAPEDLRSDRELIREFPPKILEGLCDGQLCWRSPATITFDREQQAKSDAAIARQAKAKPRSRAHPKILEEQRP